MLARRLALAIALVAALIGSQGPEFAQQYRQRAGGALDELRRIVARFDAEAAGENLTPSDAIRRLEADGDPLARKRGEDMQRTIAREDRLAGQLQAMATAGPLKRLFVLVAEMDPEVARGALDAYEPAAPLTFEAAVAAGVAACLGWVATHLVAWPFRRRPRGRTPSARSA
jgi:hypothetical protein